MSMNQDLKSKVWHVVLTALGVGLAAICSYLASLIKAHYGV